MKLEFEVRAEPIEGTERFTAVVYGLYDDPRLPSSKIWTWPEGDVCTQGFMDANVAETVCAIDFYRLMRYTLTTLASVRDTKSKILVTN